MPTWPRVSIITPSYNQAEFLEQTIRSVLEQNYPELEYIIIDGASRDNSPEIIQKYASHLAYWVSEPDHGQAEAINKGFQRASGEIIAWLNSDDVYTPGAIQAAVQALQAAQTAGFVYGNTLSMDEKGQVFHVTEYGDWSLEDLMCFNIIGQPGVFMRRSVLQKAGGLNPDLHYMLDHQLWLRMALLAPFEHKNQVWASARFHANAKNVSQGVGFGNEALKLVQWMESAPEFSVLNPQLSRKVRAGAYRLNGWYLSEGQNGWPAFKFYLRSFLQHPPTALRDWKRILYSFGLIFKATWVRDLYAKVRSGRARQKGF
jgi:glycosyltransferase involved in cell wall biosynthesis